MPVSSPPQTFRRRQLIEDSVTKYCSRSCQKTAWPGHKSTCGSFVRAREEFLYSGNAVMADKYTTISKWATCWKETLVSYGLAGMDITHHPADRMSTHMYVQVRRQF